MRNWTAAAAMAGFVAASVAALPARASEIPQPLIEQVRSWMTEPTVLVTIRSWNEKHAELTQAEIDEMDQAWRKQTESSRQPIIAEISGAPLSNFLLRKKAQSGGRLIEVFVMSARGLNVGISSVTSDYWQGDEAKFQQTFDKGADAIHFGEVEVKEDSGHRAQQVSMTVTDPETGEPIGAITAEFDLDVVAMYQAGS